MGKLKFGDKVQLVSLTQDAYKHNVLNGREPLRYNSHVQLGDTGVIVREPSLYNDARVIFQTVHGSTDTIAVQASDLMIESDESNIKLLENITKLQEAVKVSSKKYSTLDSTMIFDETRVKVGCQNISKADALQIAADITAHFGK